MRDLRLVLKLRVHVLALKVLNLVRKALKLPLFNRKNHALNQSLGHVPTVQYKGAGLAPAALDTALQTRGKKRKVVNQSK